jgi:hypothetical protein
MKKHTCSVALAMVLLYSPMADASSSQRTDQMLWDCTGKENGDLGRLACGNFIDGMVAMHSLSAGMGGASFFCSPDSGISIDQAMRIFISWAEQNPKELHKSARVSVLLSLIDAFPCK